MEPRQKRRCRSHSGARSTKPSMTSQPLREPRPLQAIRTLPGRDDRYSVRRHERHAGGSCILRPGEPAGGAPPFPSRAAFTASRARRWIKGRGSLAVRALMRRRFAASGSENEVRPSNPQWWTTAMVARLPRPCRGDRQRVPGQHLVPLLCPIRPNQNR